jgi:aldose 1-epimerase
MHFSIRHVQENDLSLMNIRDEKTGTEISLLPAYGATLHAFRVFLRERDRARQPTGSNGAFNMIDGYKDLDEVKQEMGRSFKGPKLSPFPCRIGGGKYQFEGKGYSFGKLFSDGNAIHGLLFDKAFKVADQSAGGNSASVTLQYSYKKEDPAYPFSYDCRVKYILHTGNLLEVQTTVTNIDERTIPIADGWHPYFRLGGKIDDWWLQFNAASIVEFTKQLVPSGRLLKYDAFNRSRLIGHTQLDNCFVLESGKTNPACELFNPATGLRISFCTDSAYPYLQLYTPPGRESIAVENLSAAPDCLNNKMGLILLPPGDSQTFTVNYKVSVG